MSEKAALGRYRTIVVDPPWDHSDGTGINIETGNVTALAGWHG